MPNINPADNNGDGGRGEVEQNEVELLGNEVDEQLAADTNVFRDIVVAGGEEDEQNSSYSMIDEVRVGNKMIN